MTAPNMATITASIERSLQNCSLNHQSRSSGAVGPSTFGAGTPSSTSDSPEILDVTNNSLELNSGIPLPYHWEQCLDLQTGEVYFINWRTGMKSQEDPRTNPEMTGGGFDSEDDSSYDSEGSSLEASPSSSGDQRQYNPRQSSNDKSQVLVVAGCKSCFMYFMVPKLVEDCPKCCGQLLHFDRSENGSS